jgi:arsenite/tail-anchored protein-transporting ATPase
MPKELIDALDTLSGRQLVMFGGKGGVGKSTLSSTAALHFAGRRKTILFSSDPASSLPDLFGEEPVAGLTVDWNDPEELYRVYLESNLETFLELGDRGTYLDREELRRFFELALPGVDELMSWLRIGDLAAANPEAMVVVDSAPTGHTLRMLGSFRQFTRFGEALDVMQSKHRALVDQLTRTRTRDAIDEFLQRFHDDLRRRYELLSDASRTAFVPVFLAEEWVIEQTVRLASEVRALGVDIPFVVLNRAEGECDCPLSGRRRARERAARERLAADLVVPAPRSCVPLGTLPELRAYLAGTAPQEIEEPALPLATASSIELPRSVRALFLAGKGGVGKTTLAASLALRAADLLPEGRVVLLSIDPAHGLRDAAAAIDPPSNLTIELVDTAAEWETLRETIGASLTRAVESLTPAGLRFTHDADVMQHLMDAAPPGADEIFAVVRLHELLTEERPDLVIVDTAPTGHFLRFLDLPRTAGEWVREFLRILLRYRELIPPGELAEQLVRASKALSSMEAFLRSSSAAAVVVTRAEPLVASETGRLTSTLRERQMPIRAVVVNYLAPLTECRCDRIRRAAESATLRSLQRDLAAPLLLIEERDGPLTAAGDLRALVPLVLTSA